MRLTFLSALLSVGFLLGCSQIQNSKRLPSGVNDVGVLSPNGEIFLYYREGSYIIVKACEPNTILGMSPSEARANCQGKSNRVPVEAFKYSLRRLVSIDKLRVLKPLTPKEVKEYSKGGPNASQIQAMITELEKINKFITAYGAENANLVRKEELIKALGSQKTRIIAMNKINAEVEKAVNLIVDQTKLTLKKFNSDKDQFLYNVLKSYNPNTVFQCGLSGSIDERIKDCSGQLGSKKINFLLVTRSKNFREVYKDVLTGKLWGDLHLPVVTYADFIGACTPNHDQGGGIPGVKWRRPTMDDYRDADSSGIRESLSDMKLTYWTSTRWSQDDDYAMVYMGKEGDFAVGLIDDEDDISYYAVRCVAESDKL